MEWVLIIGMISTGLGILIGLYLPILADHATTLSKIRFYAIVGAVLVIAGTACEVVSVWPVSEIEVEEQDASNRRDNVNPDTSFSVWLGSHGPIGNQGPSGVYQSLCFDKSPRMSRNSLGPFRRRLLRL